MTEFRSRFDVSGHEKYYEYSSRYFFVHMLETGHNLFTFLERWGELMEEKMKKGPLTLDVMNRTCGQVMDEQGDVDGETLNLLFDTMATVWVHGQKMPELAYKRGTTDLVALYRAMTHNRSFDFLANYPHDLGKINTSTREGRRAENVRVLSNVVPNIKLINIFEKYATSSENMCNYFVEAMCVPKQVFFGEKEYAFSRPDFSDPNWRNEIKSICAGARLRLANQAVKGKSAGQE